MTIIAVVALVGCESVNSRHVIGARITEDLSEKLNGTWVFDDGALVFHQASPGEVRVAGVEWNDETKKFETMELTLIVSRLGEANFFNLVRSDELNPLEQSEVEGTWYQFIHYELGDNELTIRGISTDAFAKAVEAGTLEGRVDAKRDAEGTVTERHVWIEGEKSALDAFVRAGDIDELFDGEPGTLRRLTDEDE